MKLLLLAKKNNEITELLAKYPEAVSNYFVSPNEVAGYLIAADYGFLVRENSITNRVASPVKFAEYLACGLKILISKDLGDFTEFVERNNLGLVVSESNFEKCTLAQSNFDEKLNIKSTAAKLVPVN